MLLERIVQRRRKSDLPCGNYADLCHIIRHVQRRSQPLQQPFNPGTPSPKGPTDYHTRKGELRPEGAVGLAEKQIFGTKSELIVADLVTQSLLPELALPDQGLKADPDKQEIAYKRKKPSWMGSNTISFSDDLPVERVVLDLPPRRKAVPGYGTATGQDRRENQPEAGPLGGTVLLQRVRPPQIRLQSGPDFGVNSASLPDAVIPHCPA